MRSKSYAMLPSSIVAEHLRGNMCIDLRTPSFFSPPMKRKHPWISRNGLLIAVCRKGERVRWSLGREFSLSPVDGPQQKPEEAPSINSSGVKVRIKAATPIFFRNFWFINSKNIECPRKHEENLDVRNTL